MEYNAILKKKKTVLVLFFISLVIFVPAGAAGFHPNGADLFHEKISSFPSFTSLQPVPVHIEKKKISGNYSFYTGMNKRALSNTTETARAQFSTLPFSFIPNTGQLSNPEISFMVMSSGSSLYFTPGEVLIAVDNNMNGNQTSEIIRQEFIGANRNPDIEGADILPGTFNFLKGNDSSRWRRNLPTYGKIVYSNLYPGIDLAYYGSEGYLKREFHVQPGADPASIVMRYHGAKEISVDENNVLQITTAAGELRESPPICYQDKQSERVAVNASYQVSGNDTVQIAVSMYDPDFPLIIDPQLGYSTYQGGTVDNKGIAIAVDGNGYAYVTGFTTSHDFPTTEGEADISNSGAFDADVIVVKMNNAANALPVFSTLYGGSGDDVGDGIGVDSAGNVYVAGSTTSSDFDVVNATYASPPSSSENVFAFALNPGGSGALYSTYFGGTAADSWCSDTRPSQASSPVTAPHGNSISVDPSGNVYVTGTTEAINFPTTPGAAFQVYQNNQDAFVFKLDPSGRTIYSTYFGGSGGDQGYGIAVNNSGFAYVTGSTSSGNFPTTNGTAFTEKPVNGGQDAFVFQLNQNGGLTGGYSTYYGGNRTDVGYGIAVDSEGYAYVTGSTLSQNLMTTPGVVNASKLGGTSTRDAFILKLNPTGNLTNGYATYYGGTSDDFGTAIAVNSTGYAYITGDTSSSNFPTTTDRIRGIGTAVPDAFLVILKPDASAPYYSTFLGGDGEDHGYGIAIDRFNSTYLTGWTVSSNFPDYGAVNATRISGSSNAFVTKFFLGPVPDPSFTNSTPLSGGVPLTVQFNDTTLSPTTILAWNWSFGDGSSNFITLSNTSRNVSHTYQNTGTYLVNLSVTNETGINTTQSSTVVVVPPSVSINVNGNIVDWPEFGVGTNINTTAISINVSSNTQWDVLVSDALDNGKPPGTAGHMAEWDNNSYVPGGLFLGANMTVSGYSAGGTVNSTAQLGPVGQPIESNLYQGTFGPIPVAVIQDVAPSDPRLLNTTYRIIITFTAETP